MSKFEDTGKKRKGASEPTVTTKKVKTTTVEKPMPKSAMKKTETVKKEVTKKEVTKKDAAPAAKPARKRAEDFLEQEDDKPAKKTVTKKTTVTEPAKPVSGESAASKVSKSKGKAKNKPVEVVEEEITIAEDSESDDDNEDVDDQTAALLAGFESSEDERDPQDEGMPLDKVPSVPKDKELRKQLKEAQEDPESTPGVIYVGRIPHGFYENQMREYFSQFGDITHLRMARNKFTGRSKHYAFVEFGSSAVADIVTKTMDKYLLFGHIMQVRRVPAEQVHENLWKGEGRRFKVMPRNKIEGGLLKRGTTREGWEKRIQNENKNRSKKADKLKELGYEFEMPALRDVNDVATKDALEAEAAPLLDAGEIKAVLDKQEQKQETKAKPEKTTVTEKAGTKRTKSKGDGKKAKKARVST